MAKNGNNAFNSGPGGNQFLDQTFERGADMVQGRMTNSVAGQGLSNSGVQQMYGRDLNDLATGIYGGAYEGNQNRRLQSGMAMSGMQQQARENDLGRMFQGAMASPGMANQIAQFGLGMGDVERDFNQTNINDAVGQWESAQNYPYRSLDAFGQAIGMGMGAGGQVEPTYGGGGGKGI
tara:strand:- start:144 stop:677 length:534 start_codon:yes stop_codon:yes gene_type:complete